MYYNIFDIFKIGIGPSSSHTIGPMNASNMFIKHIDDKYTIYKLPKEESTYVSPHQKNEIDNNSFQNKKIWQNRYIQ